METREIIHNEHRSEIKGKLLIIILCGLCYLAEQRPKILNYLNPWRNYQTIRVAYTPDRKYYVGFTKPDRDTYILKWAGEIEEQIKSPPQQNL